MRNTGILYVEDDENDVFLLQLAFQQAGITEHVEVVHTGQAAIDYLQGSGVYEEREKYPLPDLVLLDLKLPGVSGLEVLGWIRARPDLRSIVVIVLSSSSRPEDVGRAYELGANSYVLKPVDVPERLQMAKLLQGWWLELNQFAPAVRPGTSK